VAKASIRATQRGVALADVYRLPSPTKKSRARRASTVDLGVSRPTPAEARRAARLRSRRDELGVTARITLVETFLTLFGGLYAHLPLKRAMYALDPLQRLRLLEQQAPSMDEMAFHYELAGILTRLRDAHTSYVGPTRLKDHVAMLPFLVESYGPLGATRYMVSKTVKDRSLIGDPNFVPQVELLWWNGVPIDRAVELYAEYETGGRPDSRRARAVESLTTRSLQYGPPPDERWVAVGYRDLNEVEREVVILWRVVAPGRAPTAGRAGTASASRFALDPARENVRRAKKLQFNTSLWKADRDTPRASPRRRRTPPEVGKWVRTPFQDAVAAKRVRTSSGVFGYLRLWSFDLEDDEAFVKEVMTLLGLLGEDGLIIDLRGNPGGLIWAAERLLQLFGPQEIAPTRFSLLATELTRAMVHARQNETDLGPWRASLDEALSTGELYSLAIPITVPEACNDIGQVYGGPVVAVVDPNTYSAGDLFAAGFYDNGLGILVTVGTATGGGGANVWWPDLVQDALQGTGEFEPRALPRGVGYSLAFRRATRGAGDAVGAPIEDVGVRGHRTYEMTRDDLIDGNRDLLNFCGRLLTGMPSTGLKVQGPRPGVPFVKVATRGLDRVDLDVDGRQGGSKEVTDDTPATLDVPPDWESIEVQGYSMGQIRQRRRIPRESLGEGG
jgi:hypothetical protein